MVFHGEGFLFFGKVLHHRARFAVQRSNGTNRLQTFDFRFPDGFGFPLRHRGGLVCVRRPPGSKCVTSINRNAKGKHRHQRGDN
jgi:hypothetical protein